MGVIGLNHVSVTVADMDRALAFWSDALGLKLLGRGTVRYPHLDQIVGLADTEIEWADVQVPGGHVIELFRYVAPVGAKTPAASQPNDVGAAHVCLEVTDMERLVASLRAAGYRSRSESAVRIPTGDWEGWQDVYFESPDGVIVELSQRPGPATPGNDP